MATTPTPTTQELLDKTNEAIARILDGAQSMAAPDRTVAYAEIDKLRTMRKELMQEVRSLTSTVRVADVSGI